VYEVDIDRSVNTDWRNVRIGDLFDSLLSHRSLLLPAPEDLTPPSSPEDFSTPALLAPAAARCIANLQPSQHAPRLQPPEHHPNGTAPRRRKKTTDGRYKRTTGLLVTSGGSAVML